MKINFAVHKLKTPLSWGSRLDSAKPPNCQAKDAECMGEYCFTLSAQSRQHRDRRKPEARTIRPTELLSSNNFEGFSIVHNRAHHRVHCTHFEQIEALYKIFCLYAWGISVKYIPSIC